MRVLMLEPAARNEHAGADQSLYYCVIGIAPLSDFGQHPFACEARRLLGETAVGIDRVGNCRIDAPGGKLGGVCRPYLEVVAAVAGRGVHEARSSVFGDVIAWKE